MQVHPNATVAQWLNDAAGAAQAVSDGLEWRSVGVGVVLLTALGLARRFAPAFGPVGAAIGQGLGMLGQMFTPKIEQEAAARAQVAEESLWQIVEVIEQVSPDDPVIKELKKAISRKTPAAFNALFDAWKKSRGG